MQIYNGKTSFTLTNNNSTYTENEGYFVTKYDAAILQHLKKLI
jgi:hypothetical protein